MIEPMNIQQLLDKNFFIPAYQRGYRWTPQQIKDFLNDINRTYALLVIDSLW